MIEALFNYQQSHNQFHDRYDYATGSRIEIKFSTVMKANDARISSKNLIDQCIKANLGNRTMKSSDINNFSFDCNIQQIKCAEFDVLYYGLFFSDQIAIFKMTNKDVPSCPGYSGFQHKGNEGEGQFHLNQGNIDWHLDNRLIQWLSYDELYNLFP